MKPTVLKLSPILLLFAFICAGCQKENFIDKNGPFELYYAIHNEEGKRVTRLKEGENFYFYFSIENTTNRNCPIDDHHQLRNDELFIVFKKEPNSNNIIQIGGIQLFGCNEILGCLGQANSKYEYELRWSVDEESFENVICCDYKLVNQAPLPTGKYLIKYTGSILYYHWQGEDNFDNKETGNYDLKYEFEIIE